MIDERAIAIKHTRAFMKKRVLRFIIQLLFMALFFTLVSVFSFFL